MTEEKKPREITAKCDFCPDGTQQCKLIVLHNKEVMVLCETHLTLLKSFCEKIDVKWSEITL